MSSERAEPEAPKDPQRLNGWKEIAVHLGKGVRTVQRWEHDYGLPVRRIGRPGGEIVFAFKGEIDRWSAESGPRVQTANETEAETIEPEQAVVEAPPERVTSGRTRAVATAVVLVAAVLGLGFVWLSPSPQPARAIIQGKELIALDVNDRRLWAHAVDFEPDATASNFQWDAQYGMRKILVTDLDADGRNEVILSTSSVGGRGPQGFRVLNADGDLRFRIEPGDTVAFGNEAFAGPWTVYRMFITDNPDGSRSIWTAFIHGLWFPSLVLETDARGAIKSKYWSNGYVEEIVLGDIAGRPHVLIGGTHNDSRGASVAIFEHGTVRGSAPALQDRYKCRNCEPGGPKEFLVFPRTCVAEALAGQATAHSLRTDNIGRLFLLAAEGHRNAAGDFPVGLWFTVEPDFNSGSVRLSIGTPAAHRELEKTGRLNHPFEGPPHQSPHAGFLKWNGSTFASVVVPTVPIPVTR